MGYIATGDENIVLKTTESPIDLEVYISRYLSIKQRYLDLPELKTVPDQETLDKYNEEIQILRESSIVDLRNQANVLYQVVKPIYDAGLWPDNYESQYQQLVNFVNGV